MLGIGIDTGGTCTDAVIFDLEKNEILAAAKTLTTKEDLKEGIEAALSQLPPELMARCEMVALSTTLATNACVEGKGGHGKLILFGADRGAFFDTHASYGIEDPEDVLLVPCRLSPESEKCVPPDWHAFRAQLPDFLAGCDCVSVVQLFSTELLGSVEKEAERIIRESFDIPVICGHTLFPDRNIFRRGAGALLNARLIPVLHEFLTAVKTVFAQRGLAVPVTIVRSDGSQMSEAFAAQRPVETLLSGPAASVIGAGVLSSAENAVIVDMGGTTTDVSIIKNGLPERAGDGICVGSWKTFVKGLFVDTFGLGGDTAIHYELNHGIRLENYRVIPLCVLASRYPQVELTLRRLDESERVHGHFLHEFLTLLKMPPAAAGYSENETALCNALSEGPLSLLDAAAAIGTDIYKLNFERLERDGIVLRAGLTPTDIMHIRGEFTAYNEAASRYAAAYVCKAARIGSIEELCDAVYDAVEKRLYENLVRILITTQMPAFAGTRPREELSEYISSCYEMAREASETESNIFFIPTFQVNAKLVGVGAPTHLFLPKVARLLHMPCVIPEHAHVANAAGAIAGRVIARIEIEIRPGGEGGIEGFEVNTGEEKFFFEDHEEAIAAAITEGEMIARRSVLERGAAGEITTIHEVKRQEAVAELVSLWLSDTVIVTATGNLAQGVSPAK